MGVGFERPAERGREGVGARLFMLELAPSKSLIEAAPETEVFAWSAPLPPLAMLVIRLRHSSNSVSRRRDFDADWSELNDEKTD